MMKLLLLAFGFSGLLHLPVAWAHEGCEHLLEGGLLQRARHGLERLKEGEIGTADQKEYFSKIVQAAEAAVDKHQTLFAADKDRKLDHARHQLILKTIAEVDANRRAFSAYKIKRAIEGRYSIDEYIRCK